MTYERRWDEPCEVSGTHDEIEDVERGSEVLVSAEAVHFEEHLEDEQAEEDEFGYD